MARRTGRRTSRVARRSSKATRKSSKRSARKSSKRSARRSNKRRSSTQKTLTLPYSYETTDDLPMNKLRMKVFHYLSNYFDK